MSAAAVYTPPASQAARRLFLKERPRPRFLADWVNFLFLHFRVPARSLRELVPLPLDLRADHAYVSLVAFRMERMRLTAGGRFGRWALAPMATHNFLNVRTYVIHEGEPGILFLKEYIPNALSRVLGPLTYGLPYRLARVDYRTDCKHGRYQAAIRHWRHGQLTLEADWEPGATETLMPDHMGAFLLERYTAYTRRRDRTFRFRVWHPPWEVARASVTLGDDSLLRNTEPWYEAATLAGAHAGAGFRDVWMGDPVAADD